MCLCQSVRSRRLSPSVKLAATVGKGTQLLQRERVKAQRLGGIDAAAVPDRLE